MHVTPIHKKRVLILVLTCLERGFEVMDACVRKTWGAIAKKRGIDIYYLYSTVGLSKEIEIQEETNSIWYKGPEGYCQIGYKTLGAFKAIQTKKYDYILRTNSSSFILLDNLLKYLDNAPLTGFYAGPEIPYHTTQLSFEFASGAGYILSRDLVDRFVAESHLWDHSYPDDVSVGKFLLDRGINFTSNEWVKITSLPVEESFKAIQDKFHIRCKIETRYDNETQCVLMHELNKLAYQQELCREEYSQ